ncbi:MAG: YXWGXW repeat-containing protein [Acidobacteriota bacterium]
MRFLRFLLAPLALLIPILTTPAPASAQVVLSVAIAPPALPVYVQPPIPAPGYIWTPGYWAYGPYGYYWVPGTWVLPPAIGLLWTPGYWGWSNGAYLWHAGYWGPHIGFYGGINYGFGYFGTGFVGGYWQGGRYYYNSAYSNFGGVHVTNVYNRTVVYDSTSHVSYNGGAGGINRQVTADERLAERDHHVNATSLQTRHERLASNNPDLRHSVNHGNPTLTATSRAGRFGSSGPAGSAGTKGGTGSKSGTASKSFSGQGSKSGKGYKSGTTSKNYSGSKSGGGSKGGAGPTGGAKTMGQPQQHSGQKGGASGKSGGGDHNRKGG